MQTLDLLSEPISLLDHGYVRYVSHMGDDLTPLEAARMSTGNPTGVDRSKDAATRDYLWRHAHATPFEMAVLQIEVQCPIFVAREWMRHRSASYNEYSQRYSEALDLYYTPTTERVRGQSETNKQGSGSELSEATKSEFLDDVEAEQQTSRKHYEGYLEKGIARELARINMPVSNYTKFRTQANLRNWLHFLNLRMAENAQYEIRVYAQAVARIVKQLWPETWAVFEEHTLEAMTLSRTEREVLIKALSRLGAESATIEAAAGDRLSKGRLRELLGKLGLT